MLMVQTCLILRLYITWVEHEQIVVNYNYSIEDDKKK